MGAGSAFDALLRKVRMEFPVPIADAVVEYEGARDLHERTLKLIEVFRAALHLVAAVALAARLGRGPGPKGEDAPEVARLMEDLRRRGLSDGQWVALTRALLQPWREAPEGHPLPELVRWFDPRDGRLAVALGELVERRNEIAHGPKGKGAPRTLEPLAKALESPLAQLLSSLAPLWERVSLAVVLAQRDAAGVPLGWQMVGQTPFNGRWRTTSLPAAKDVAAGEALLVDGAGRLVLALEPALLVRRPSPEAVEAVFTLDGGEKNDARYLALPSTAVLTVAEVWSRLRVSLVPEPEGGAGEGDAPDRPYRGLESFGPEHAALFFGRTALVEALSNRIRRHGLVTVTGPSAVGKTSLLRAGVGPELARRNRLAARGTPFRDGDDAAGGLEYRMVYARPGVDPWGNLLRALERALEAWSAPTGDAREDAAAVVDSLRTYAGEQRCRVVLALDQAEELFTLSEDAGLRARWGALLAGLGGDEQGPTRVVLSLREDWIARLATLPSAGPLVGRQVEVVNRPDREGLLRVLVEPAERFGVRFEAGLAEAMVDAVGETPAALALLQFTADRLWERRGAERVLTRAAYEALGGVKGSLGQHADGALATMTAAEQRTAKELLLGMVTAAGTRAARAESELLAEVSRTDGRAVLDKLTAARLVTRQDDPATVDVVHEALLSEWPRMLAWRAEDEEGIVWRARLREAVADWKRNGRAAGWLWGAEVLAGLGVWEAKRAVTYGEEERGFVEASRQRARWTKRARWATVAGVMAALAGFGGFAAVQSRTARAKELVAVREREIARYHTLLERAHELDSRGQPTEAAMILAAAAQSEIALQLRDGTAHADLIEHTNHALAMVFRSDTGNVTACSPDGTRLVTASNDNTATVWNVRTGGRLFTLRGHSGLVRSLAFSGDGRMVATGSEDWTTRLWDLSTGRLVCALEGHLGRVGTLSFSRDGTRLVTGSHDGTARVWDVPTGHLLTVVDTHMNEAGAVTGASFSPDATRLATGSERGRTQIWDASTGALLRTLADQAAPRAHHFVTTEVRELSFSPDGARIAAEASDEGVKIWEAPTGRLLSTVHAGSYAGNSLVAISFSTDGTCLIAGSSTGRAETWDSSNGRQLDSFEARPMLDNSTRVDTDLITSGVLSNRGWGRTITSSREGGVRVWDMPTDRLLRTFEGHTDLVESVAFSLDGSRLVTGSIDRTARVWDVAQGRLLRTLEGHTDSVTSAAFSPDGTWLVTGSMDRTARVWEVSTGRLLRTLEGHAGAVYAVAVSPSGGWLATASADRTARVWEASTGRLLRTLEGHTSEVGLVAASPNRPWLVTGSADRTARVWSALDGRSLHVLEGHTAAVTAAFFLPDARRLMTGSIDGTARVWDAENGRPLHTLEGRMREIVASAGSPDGARAATASDGVAWIREVSTGRLLLALRAHRNGARISSVSFSPDGTRLATSGELRARLWRADSVDVRDAISEVLRRTNLRTCRESLALVPVVLTPATLASVWAPPAACQAATEPSDPPPAEATPASHAERAVRVEATVTSATGVALRPGSRCGFTVTAIGVRCHADVVCGALHLFGSDTQGFFPCTAVAGAAPQIVGHDDATGDGDGAFAVDTGRHTLAIRDVARNGRPAFAVEARITAARDPLSAAPAAR